MKLDLSALAPAVKPAAKAKAPKPLMPVNDKAMIDALATQLDEAEVLDGSITAIKKDLVDECMPKWLSMNANSGIYNGTVELVGDERVVQMSFKSAFTKVDATKADTVRDAVGKKAFDAFFRSKVDAKLSFDAVPEAKQQKLVEGLAALLTELGCLPALTLTNVIVPVDGFNELRATRLTATQNAALETVQRTVVSFKRKSPTATAVSE